MLPLLVVALAVVAWYLPGPRGLEDSWRTLVIVATTVILWASSLLPSHVVALGLLTVYHATGMGPTSVGLSGFASAGWFLLLGILVLGVALVASGLLDRLARALLAAFPPTFGGQVVALFTVGVVMTPALPLTVARCALIAPLAAKVARLLGYTPLSRGAVGLGLAAFTGTGLLARNVLSGATLNLIAWHLLPAEQRLSWTAWAVAAAPATLVMLGGSLLLVLLLFRPSGPQRSVPAGPPVPVDAPVRITPREWITGSVVGAALAGFIVGPAFGVEPPWIASGSAFVLLATGVIGKETLRASLDWPLLIFLGTVLSLPEILRHAGLDGTVAGAVTGLVARDTTSAAWTITTLFLVTTAARFLLSEWVAVPVLAIALVPLGPVLGLHPWIIVFTVLVGSNAWFFPYQFTSYVAFLAGSEGQLFEPSQVRVFSVAYLALSLLGLVAAIPLWRALGLLQ